MALLGIKSFIFHLYYEETGLDNLEGKWEQIFGARPNWGKFLLNSEGETHLPICKRDNTTCLTVCCKDETCVECLAHSKHSVSGKCDNNDDDDNDNNRGADDNDRLTG